MQKEQCNRPSNAARNPCSSRVIDQKTGSISERNKRGKNVDTAK